MGGTRRTVDAPAGACSRAAEVVCFCPAHQKDLEPPRHPTNLHLHGTWHIAYLDDATRWPSRTSPQGEDWTGIAREHGRLQRPQDQSTTMLPSSRRDLGVTGVSPTAFCAFPAQIGAKYGSAPWLFAPGSWRPKHETSAKARSQGPSALPHHGKSPLPSYLSIIICIRTIIPYLPPTDCRLSNIRSFREDHG